MKLIILTTTEFTPPEMTTLPADIAAKCNDADVVVAVYQNMVGESQVAVTVPTEGVMPDVEVWDVD